MDWKLTVSTNEKGAGELIYQILESNIPFEEVLIKSPAAPAGVVMLPCNEWLLEALQLQSYEAAS